MQTESASASTPLSFEAGIRVRETRFSDLLSAFHRLTHVDSSHPRGRGHRASRLRSADPRRAWPTPAQWLARDFRGRWSIACQRPTGTIAIIYSRLILMPLVAFPWPPERSVLSRQSREQPKSNQRPSRLGVRYGALCSHIHISTLDSCIPQNGGFQMTSNAPWTS